MVNEGIAFPVFSIVLYFVFSYVALTLCLVSLIAILRTKKTPYSTKMLSLGLLVFDCLFLIFSGISKLYRFTERFLLQQLARGFHVSSYIVIGSMALERLFVLNWPYVYMKVTTKRLTRLICLGICSAAFLHYLAVRGLGCYARMKFVDCGMGIQMYFITISVVVPIISFISYGKIYTIVRQKGAEQHFKYRLTQYKGTIVSFLYLINTTINTIVYLGLASFYIIRSSKGVKEDGLVAMMTDSMNVVNCIVDPLIYVLLFKETRLEILKIIAIVFPMVRPKIQKMHMDIFDITTCTKSTA